LVFQFSLLQRGLGAGLGSSCLLELESVWLGLDDEERRPLLHLLAILVVDLLQEALHSRDQVGSADCGSVADGLEVACDLLLHRNRHADAPSRARLLRGKRQPSVHGSLHDPHETRSYDSRFESGSLENTTGARRRRLSPSPVSLLLRSWC